MTSVWEWLKGLLDRLDNPLFDLGGTKISTLSLIIFVATLCIAVALGTLTRRAIRRYFAGKTKVDQGAVYAIERIAQIAILVAGVLVGLENIGVDLTALTALGAVLSVGIGFGLQGVVGSWVAGLTILVERTVQRGDFIIVGDTVGIVDEISMRATRVLTRDQVAIIVPNHELVTGTVKNMTQPNRVYRVRIPVGVAYGSDTAEVRRVLLDVAREHAKVLDDPPPHVFFVDFGSSSLDFQLAVWIDHPETEPDTTSELRFAIDRAFREAGIEIPFPQRDLHLRSVDGKAARTLRGETDEHPADD